MCVLRRLYDMYLFFVVDFGGVGYYGGDFVTRFVFLVWNCCSAWFVSY